MLNQTECDCVFSKAFESYWVSACRWSAVALVIILTRYCASCVTCERQISVTFPVERGKRIQVTLSQSGNCLYVK